ncbi:MAG: Protein GrpE [Promethearchaeota archaeon]|nr:MAG: Protein GrpE [Candidatus Lokiarchaeota archaeon]
MVFGNHFDKMFDPQKYSHSGKEQKKITVEEFNELKEKAQKVPTLASENEDLQKKNKELKAKLEDAEQKVEDLKEKNKNYLNRLQRLQADFENYRKRIDKENSKFRLYALEKIIKKLISYYDDLERAKKVIHALDVEDSVKQGFEMIIKNFKKLLEEEGVRPMKSEGEKFDPYKHDAMMVRKDEECPENTVVEELEKGYYLNNEVLRPAKVVVSKKSC